MCVQQLTRRMPGHHLAEAALVGQEPARQTAETISHRDRAGPKM